MGGVAGLVVDEPLEPRDVQELHAELVDRGVVLRKCVEPGGQPGMS
jgi:hypothetical protein